MSNTTQENDCHSKEKYNLWGGRFEAGNDQLMKMFNESIPFDKRFWKEDLNVFDLFSFLIILFVFNLVYFLG